MLNANAEFLNSHKHFAILIHQRCSLWCSCEDFMSKELKNK